MFTMKDSHRQSTAVIKPNRENKTLSSSSTASKSSATIQNAEPLESIIFDRGAAERQEMYLRDAHAFRIQKPWLDFKEYTFEKWLDDILFDSQPASLQNQPDEVVEERLKKAEMARKAFFYKRPFIDNNGHCIGTHPAELVPYPLPYDVTAFTNDINSHKLLKRIYHGWPSIHRFQFDDRHPKRVLDLGCGDGTWIIDSAQCWTETQFYGIDLQKLWPSRTELAEEYGVSLANNIKFVTFNFLLDQLPFLDGVFNMVRMANLKWCIPEYKWDEVMSEVHRVTARAGLVEIIDDDFVTFTDSESNNLTKKDKFICEALERRFAKFLLRRQLPLDTYEFMVGMLKKHFQTVHQDVIPIGISSETKPIYTKQKKTGKRWSGRSSVGAHDGGKSLARIMSRVRLSSGSSSSINLLSENGNEERPLPPRPRPLGLVLPTLNRCLPCTDEEILTHATKNMQSVLCAMIVIRKGKELKHPEMKMTSKWKESLWTYERTISDRLNLNISRCGFDLDSDDECEEKKDSLIALSPPKKKEAIHPVSTVGQLKKDESPWDGGHESIAQELAKKYDVDKLVRIIRVYTMWR